MSTASALVCERDPTPPGTGSVSTALAVPALLRIAAPVIVRASALALSSAAALSPACTV